MIVVSDTSVISNLANVGQLGLLQRLYGKLVIPLAVYQELLQANREELTNLVIENLAWIEVRSIQNTALLNTIAPLLDRGEAEAIALTVEVRADRLIIDEKKGRKKAIELGIKVTGILGILLAAKQSGYIQRIEPILNALRSSGFWVNEDLYLEVLRLAGESYPLTDV
jgi:predicted nucleic acid-binding protein